MPPAPTRGTLQTDAASRLAELLERNWDTLTARPFTGDCPTAYDGQEVIYAIRRLPSGPDAPYADADVREIRSCTHDLGHPAARDVLRQLDSLSLELGLPPS